MTFPANITALIQDRLKPVDDALAARLDDIEAFINDRHLLQSSALQTHQGPTLTNAINSSVDVDGGTYKITVSYSWSVDNNGNSWVSELLIDGVAPYAGPYLHIQETKESGNTTGTQEAGTGTDQIQPMTMVLEGVALAAGTRAVSFSFGGLTGGGALERNLRDLSIKIERTSFP